MFTFHTNSASIERAFQSYKRLPQAVWDRTVFELRVMDGAPAVWPYPLVMARLPGFPQPPVGLGARMAVEDGAPAIVLYRQGVYHLLDGRDRILHAVSLHKDIKVIVVTPPSTAPIVAKAEAKTGTKAPRFWTPPTPTRFGLYLHALGGHDIEGDTISKADVVQLLSSYRVDPKYLDRELWYVIGHPGAGKSEWAKKHRAIDLDVPLDSVYLSQRKDPVFVEDMKLFETPFHHPGFRNAFHTVADTIMGAALVKQKRVVVVGAHLPWFIPTRTFLLDTPLEVSYRRQGIRHASIFPKEAMKQEYEKEPLHMIPHDVCFRYKIRVPFHISFDLYKEDCEFRQKDFMQLFPNTEIVSLDQLSKLVVA
jgi:hypothetical protein